MNFKKCLTLVNAPTQKVYNKRKVPLLPAKFRPNHAFQKWKTTEKGTKPKLESQFFTYWEKDLPCGINKNINKKVSPMSGTHFKSIVHTI